MRAKNNAGQLRLALQRVFVILCVFLLFTFIGIMLSLSPEVYAHSTVMEHRLTTNVACTTNTPVVPTPTPTNTPVVPTATPTDTPVVLTPTPTNTPIVPTPTPTDTPIVPTPTPTDTPIVPTATPTNTPIISTPTVISTPTTTATTTQTTANKNLLSEHVQVILPCNTPTTTTAKPTGTSAAGVLPPVGTSMGGSTQQGTPTPTPSPASMTPTPSGSGLAPTSTNVAPTPTPNGYSTVVTGPSNGKLLLPSMPELAIGSSVLGAAAVVGWFVWRRRQGLSSTGLAQTQPAYNSSQTPYTQTAFAAGNAGIVRENRAFYQEDTTAQAMTHMPETPLPHQAIMDSLEPSLETIMRQARTGLFALPDKEVYS